MTRLSHRPRSSQTHTPAFASVGSFDALDVENASDDSGSDEGENRVPSTLTPSLTLIKKTEAKQRAKERGGKSCHSDANSLLPDTQEPPHSTELCSDTIVETSYPSSTPITSSSVSLVNSTATSPNSTDLDDDEHEAESQDEQVDPKSDVTSPLKPVNFLASAQHEFAPEGPVPHDVPPKTTAVPSSISKSAIISPKTSPEFPASQQDNTVKKPSTLDFLPSPRPDPSQMNTGPYGADHTPGKKWQSVITRVIWSLVMVGGFVGLMTLGHVYLIVLVFIIQLSVFREVSNLFEVGYKASAREHARKQASPIAFVHQPLTLAAKERRRIKDVDKNRWSKVMSWYFFCAVNYFLYGESIIYYFKHIVFIDAYLLPFARHHRFISLLLYLVGFLAFVANLDRGHLRRQFGLFSWIHMSLLLIVASGQFMVNNILEGLIWFWVPASLVIMNDVAAYVFGMMFGKHQLIKLSPKKTVEGFIGGYFTTVIFSVLWGSLFMGWNYMICPVRDLGVTAFSDVQCVPNNVFIWRAFDLPQPMVGLLAAVLSVPPTQVWWTPFQLHCLVLGTFAGLVAPFGGFFASGFKRAFNVKDFADTIPGHGGLTDRFDCQFIMGLFTYFYYTSMVREQHVTVGSILETIASALNSSEQLELYHDLHKSLTAQGYKLSIE